MSDRDTHYFPNVASALLAVAVLGFMTSATFPNAEAVIAIDDLTFKGAFRIIHAVVMVIIWIVMAPPMVFEIRDSLMKIWTIFKSRRTK